MVNMVDEVFFLIRARMMCPALMLAARRTPRVRGRTKILIVSMRIRGGDSHGGAPVGRRLAALFFGLWAELEMMVISHRGRLRDRVIVG